MKTLRENIQRWFDKQDKNWRAFPLKKQRRYTLYFFLGYLLLTIGVVFQVWYQIAESENKMRIEHIENPALKKKESPSKLRDTMTTILNNQFYERK